MIEYVRIEAGKSLPSLSHLKAFKAVVVIEDAPGSDWQDQVSTWLVRSGCLYMMAWGLDPSSWDDSVEAASLEAHGWNGIPVKEQVWTTWHSDEDLDKVFWFAKNIAAHAHARLDDTVIVHISQVSKKQDLFRRFQAAK